MITTKNFTVTWASLVCWNSSLFTFAFDISKRYANVNKLKFQQMKLGQISRFNNTSFFYNQHKIMNQIQSNYLHTCVTDASLSSRTRFLAWLTALLTSLLASSGTHWWVVSLKTRLSLEVVMLPEHAKRLLLWQNQTTSPDLFSRCFKNR